MPKTIEYPRGSLKRAIIIAKAVQELGGNCSIETCAEHLNKQVSGSFRSQISASIKYKLITKAKGNLYVTEHFKNIEHAYNDEEKVTLLQQSFLNVQVFSELYERFKKTKLPVQMLQNLLIREFGVATNVASNVAGYFISGAKEINLLNPDLTFNQIESDIKDKNQSEKRIGMEDRINDRNDISSANKENSYTITITGPGINFKKEILKADDFNMISAIIESVKSNFLEDTGNE